MCQTAFDETRELNSLKERAVAKLSVAALVGLAVAGVSGCGRWEINIDEPEQGLFDGLNRPELANVPTRLALGATAMLLVLDADQATVSSSDLGVVAIDRLNEGEVMLTAVGVGSATVNLGADGDQRKSYSVRVAEVSRSEVLLVEVPMFPPDAVEVVPVHDQALLSGVQQQLVVAHYDADGELLHGEGLASIQILDGAEPCERDVPGPFDGACVVLRQGTNVLRFEDAKDMRDVVIVGVDESQIVDLIVMETTGAPTRGDAVGMISFGLTEEDVWVYGVQAKYEAEGLPVLESFAYDYDPEADAVTLTVRAAGFERQLEYLGTFNFDSHPKLLWSACGGWLVGSC